MTIFYGARDVIDLRPATKSVPVRMESAGAIAADRRGAAIAANTGGHDVVRRSPIAGVSTYGIATAGEVNKRTQTYDPVVRFMRRSAHRPRRLARARAMRLFETVATVIAVGLALGAIVYGMLA